METIQPKRKDLLDVLLRQPVETVEIKQVVMPPGQPAPRHLHPCPVLGYIVSGKVLFQIQGEEARILNEGDAFYEPRNATILHFDNAQGDQPLVFVAFYLKEGGEENIQLLP
ncbi:MAG TPA: cupin domain-containing protein [Chitinophagaceae bacterium]|nr:cupin domain-containing protein [Chitinophagaceae bacterium]